MAKAVSYTHLPHGEQQLPVAPAGCHNQDQLSQEIDYIHRPPASLGQIDEAGAAIDEPGDQRHSPGDVYKRQAIVVRSIVVLSIPQSIFSIFDLALYCVSSGARDLLPTGKH